MIRLPTVATVAVFAADALDDSVPLSIVAGIALALLCLWALTPGKTDR